MCCEAKKEERCASTSRDGDETVIHFDLTFTMMKQDKSKARRASKDGSEGGDIKTNSSENPKGRNRKNKNVIHGGNDNKVPSSTASPAAAAAPTPTMSSPGPTSESESTSNWLPSSVARRLEQKANKQNYEDQPSIKSSSRVALGNNIMSGNNDDNHQQNNSDNEVESSSNHSDRPGAHHVSGVNANNNADFNNMNRSMSINDDPTTNAASSTNGGQNDSSDINRGTIEDGGTPVLEATLVKEHKEEEVVMATIASDNDNNNSGWWNNIKVRRLIVAIVVILILITVLLSLALRGEIAGDRDDTIGTNGGVDNGTGGGTGGDGGNTPTISPAPTMAPILSTFFKKKVVVKELLPTDVFEEFEQELVLLKCSDVDYSLRSEDCSSRDAVAISSVKVITIENNNNNGGDGDVTDPSVDFIATLLGTKTIGLFLYDKKTDTLKWLQQVQLLSLDEVLYHKQNLDLYCSQRMQPQQQSALSFVCTVAVAFQDHAAVYQVDNIKIDSSDSSRGGTTTILNWTQLGSDFVEYSTPEDSWVEGYISVQIGGIIEDETSSSSSSIVLAIATVNYTSGVSSTAVYEYNANKTESVVPEGLLDDHWKLMGNESIPGHLDFTESPAIIDLATSYGSGTLAIAIGIMSFSGSGVVRTYEYYKNGGGCNFDNNDDNANRHWCQLGTNEIAGGDYEDFFASSLAISPGGNTVIIGAPGTYDCESGEFCSIARAYSFASNGNVPLWISKGQTIMARKDERINNDDILPPPNQVLRFGTDVGISWDGNVVAVTSSGTDDGSNPLGVYIFKFESGIWQKEFGYTWEPPDIYYDSEYSGLQRMAFSSRPPYTLVTSIGGNITIFY